MNVTTDLQVVDSGLNGALAIIYLKAIIAGALNPTAFAGQRKSSGTTPFRWRCGRGWERLDRILAFEAEVELLTRKQKKAAVKLVFDNSLLGNNELVLEKLQASRL